MKKPNQPKRLDEIVHIFKGVGHRDLFEGSRIKLAPKDAKECRIVHAKDLSEGKSWFGPRTLGRVSSRILEKRIRGFNERAVIQPGDILISNRGRPVTSPVITSEMLIGAELIAATELMVIRPKATAFGTYSPAHIRNLLEHPDSLKHIEEKAKRTEANRSIALSKEVLGAISLAPMRNDTVPFMEQSNETYAFDVETSSGKLQRIIKAIMRSGIRRLNKQPTTLSAIFIQSDGFSWMSDNSVDEKARETDAANKIAKAIDSYAGKETADHDAEALKRKLHEALGTSNPAIDLPSNHEAAEAVTNLVHYGDGAATNHSIRLILAECASESKNIAVHAAEMGHAAIEVVKTAKRADAITLIEPNDNFRKVAKSLVGLANPGIVIHELKSIFWSNKNNGFDLILSDASGMVREKASKKQYDLGAAGIFNWNGFSGQMKPEGKMIIHIPTSGWERLEEIKGHISTIIQLPPLTLPDKPSVLKERYTQCTQGLIVVVDPSTMYSDPVRVIDATRIIDGGDAGASLPRALITELARAALGQDIKILNAMQAKVRRGDLFERRSKMWPGLLTLLNNLPDDDNLSTLCTLETLQEEFAYHENDRRRKIESIFHGIGLPKNSL